MDSFHSKNFLLLKQYYAGHLFIDNLPFIYISFFSPDALYLTTFEIFDKNASDTITCDEFEKIIRHTQPVLDMDFDFSSDFIKRYFGK